MSSRKRHETGICHVILLRPVAAHVRTRRHTLDTPWMLVESVSTSWPSLFSQTNFVVQRFPQSLPYSCEERQVASARILVFQW